MSFTAAGVRRRLLLAIALAVLSLTAVTGEARAGIVTVGSPLSQAFPESVSCLRACTLSPNKLPGAAVVSPVEGAIVRWRMRGASSAATYQLRVLRHGNGLEFAGAGSSAPVQPAGPFLETFPALIQIDAGDSIGIDVEAGGPVPAREAAGAEYLIFSPPLLEGAAGTGSSSVVPIELGFDAEILPAPTISSLSPASGPLDGGNTVTIAGTDLTGASAVSFGPVPALSYTVDSETRITAVVPPDPGPGGKVPVTVVTTAGTGTAPTGYTYVSGDGGGTSGETGGGGGPSGGTGGTPGANPNSPPASPHCVVPSLRRAKLKAARRKLKRAGCALGKVKRPRGASSTAGKVVAQRPKPGTTLPRGGRVSLTLGR